MKSLKQLLNDVFPAIAESLNGFRLWVISQFQTVNNTLGQVIEAIPTKVSELENDSNYLSKTEDIGGRNYLVDSKNTTPFFGNKTFYLSESLTEGENYTLSYIYEHLRGEIPVRMMIKKAGEAPQWRTFLYTGDGLYRLTFISDGNETGFQVFTDLTTPASEEVEAIIRHIQVEKGEVLTDWTPAPEDKANVEDIPVNVSELNNDANYATQSYAQQQAQSAEQRANNHTANNFVPLLGSVIIRDTKTFTHSPIIPNATLNSHAISRGYADGRYLPISIGDFRDYGLGVTNNQYSDNIDDITENQFISSSTTGSPYYGSGFSVNRGPGRGGQFLITNLGNPNTQRVIFRSKVDIWGEWQEFWHTGNLRSNTQNDDRYFRIEVPNLATDDADNHLSTGFNFFGSNSANLPSGNSMSGTITNIQTPGATQQIYLRQRGDVMAFRTFSSVIDGEWTEWNSVWHSGNLSPVTTNTTQTITGRKQFDQVVYAPQGFAQLVAPSLRALKENIKPFKTSGIELINQLDISTFDYKDIEEEGEVIEGVKDSIGIIADDSPDEFLNKERKAVDLYKTVFIQAKAIQELTVENENLEKRLERLEEILQVK